VSSSRAVADAPAIGTGTGTGTGTGVANAVERALAAAAAAPQIVWSLDAARARADAAAPVDGPLSGLPIAVKDSIDVAGLPTRAGLPAPLHVADADAPVVAALRAAGAIVIGTTAMDELAWSMTGQAPGYPVLENPAAPGHVTGGSSGGSAAAVAAGIVPVALGTDTAGSVRVPAAWCGVTAVKPSHGRIGLAGVLALAPSFDTVGVLARSAGECARVLGALGIAPDPEPDLAGAAGRPAVRAIVLGGDVPGWFAAAAAPLWAGGWEAAGTLEALPAPRLGRILAAEFAAAWPQAPAGLSPAIRDGLERGRGIDPGVLADDRAELAAAGDALRAQLDGGPSRPVRLLVTPAVPGPAPALSDAPPVAEASRFTRLLSALGWPCASLPCGRVDGRPVALQLAAAPGDDGYLLSCAAWAQARLDPEAECA
jgi:amidase